MTNIIAEETETGQLQYAQAILGTKELSEVFMLAGNRVNGIKFIRTIGFYTACSRVAPDLEEKHTEIVVSENSEPLDLAHAAWIARACGLGEFPTHPDHR